MCKKCKNTECKNSVLENRTYCSLKCRNAYVNKNIRDYKKVGESLSKEKKYYENPKKCIVCGNIIEYKKRNNKYCNSSCAAKESNKFRKGIKHNMSKKGIESLKKTAINNFLIDGKCKHLCFDFKKRSEYSKDKKYCECCNIELTFKKRKNKFCSLECKLKFQSKNMTEFNKYKSKCSFTFNLKNFPNEFNFTLINQFGWYSAKNRGNNLKGVSRDHMLSIMEGFNQNIDSKIISHPANCELMIHSNNSKKWKNSSITIEELKNKIIQWDSKYGKFYEDLKI